MMRKEYSNRRDIEKNNQTGDIEKELSNWS